MKYVRIGIIFILAILFILYVATRVWGNEATQEAVITSPSPTPEENDDDCIFDGPIVNGKVTQGSDDNICPTASPEQSATPSASPTEAPQPPTSTENHAGEGDGKGCASHGCFDGFVHAINNSGIPIQPPSASGK